MNKESRNNLVTAYMEKLRKDFIEILDEVTESPEIRASELWGALHGALLAEAQEAGRRANQLIHAPAEKDTQLAFDAAGLPNICPVCRDPFPHHERGCLALRDRPELHNEEREPLNCGGENCWRTTGMSQHGDDCPRTSREEHPIFGKVIHSYTRKQALEDGVLVDLSALAPDVCREHYKHPIACTAAVWDIIDRAVKNERHCNDLNGVVHDVLWMSRAMKKQLDPSTVLFRVKINGAGRKSVFDFKLNVGPGDNAEPVITIMLPEED